MVREKCNVPGCVIGDADEKEKLRNEGIRLSLFSLPRDPELLEKWKKAFSEANVELSGKHVCELHFQPDEINKFLFSKMPDGTVRKYAKGRVSLKSGAIPSRFPNVSSYSSVKSPSESSKDGYEENLLNMRKAYPASTKESIDNIENADLNVYQENVSFVKDSFTYRELCEKLHLVKRPNNWWGITLTPICIICARWNDKYDVQKRIIIESSLKAKVYIKDIQINITDQMTFGCIDDISSLLGVVEGCKIDV